MEDVQKEQAVEHLDPSLAEEITDRRSALRKAGKLGIALAASPLVFGAFARDALGQDFPQKVVDALNFALTLEYLEAEFYNTGLETGGLIPDGEERAIFELIAEHENDHVAFLQNALGDAATSKPEFDFTAGGTFNPFENYQIFLALSQGFEDTGVRAYKGQAPVLLGTGDVLDAALRIHAVEARHAARVRRLRGNEGWIVGGPDNVEPDALDPTYEGEGNTTQGGIDLSSALGDQYSEAEITAAFDEPLSMDEVLATADQFIES